MPAGPAKLGRGIGETSPGYYLNLTGVLIEPAGGIYLNGSSTFYLRDARNAGN
jgi:hypothetical protein